jgi:hypothetical protein
MIKIIEEGTRHKCKCEECGCLFSYEKEDIQYQTVGFSSFKYIKCPQCMHEIDLTKGVAKTCK